jgi:hypothetical protein
VWCAPAPVYFLIDKEEEFAGPGPASEPFHLAQGVAQLQQVFSGYERPPSEAMEYPLVVLGAGLFRHAAARAAVVRRYPPGA